MIVPLVTFDVDVIVRTPDAAVDPRIIKLPTSVPCNNGTVKLVVSVGEPDHAGAAAAPVDVNI